MRDNWGKRKVCAGFVYIEVNWSSNLSLKKPILDADRTVSEKTIPFCFTDPIHNIQIRMMIMNDERVPRRIGIMQVVCLYKKTLASVE